MLGGVDVGVRHHDKAVAVAVFVGGVVDRLDRSGGLAAHCDAWNVRMVVAVDVGDMVAPAVGVGDDSSGSPEGVESLDRGWCIGVGGGRVGFLRVRDCIGLAGVARSGHVAVAGRSGGGFRNGAGTRVVGLVVAAGFRGEEGDGGAGGSVGGGVSRRRGYGQDLDGEEGGLKSLLAGEAGAPIAGAAAGVGVGEDDDFFAAYMVWEILITQVSRLCGEF